MEDIRAGIDEAAGGWKELPAHRDEHQVHLDVERSFGHYHGSWSSTFVEKRKSELSALITAVLRHNPYLHYFQGYHDICQVLLLILPPSAVFDCTARLSVLRIRDFMLHNLGPTTSQLHLIPDMIRKADPGLWRRLADIEPFYALAGTLTLYAHDILSLHKIARLFDVFLATEPVFILYVYTQIIINKRDDILEIDDMDMLRLFLSKIPTSMDLDALVTDAMGLYNLHPPETLQRWRRISPSSVLKTIRHVEDCRQQTLEEGHAYFEQQAKELRWDDFKKQVRRTIRWTMWKYRRPATLGTAALAVGILSLYIARNPSAYHQLTRFIRYHFVDV